MMQTIADLWNGNIVPCDNCGAHDRQINELVVLMARNRDNLNKEISPAQQVIFEKYIDCAEEYLLRLMEQAFCDGFSLASRLLMEALSD